MQAIRLEEPGLIVLCGIEIQHIVSGSRGLGWLDCLLACFFNFSW